MCSPVNAGGGVAPHRMHAFAPIASLLSYMMAEHREPEPTQQTKPKKGKPITIPVPEKAEVMAFLEKTANLRPGSRGVPYFAGQLKR